MQMSVLQSSDKYQFAPKFHAVIEKSLKMGSTLK